MNIKSIEKKKAYKNSLYIVALVQDTMSLENRGLDEKNLNILIGDAEKRFSVDGDYYKNLWTNSNLEFLINDIDNVQQQINILKNHNYNLYNIVLDKFKINFIHSIASKNNSLSKEDIHFLVTQGLTVGNKKFTDFIEIYSYLNVCDCMLLDYVNNKIIVRDEILELENILKIDNTIISDEIMDFINNHKSNIVITIALVYLELIQTNTNNKFIDIFLNLVLIKNDFYPIITSNKYKEIALKQKDDKNIEDYLNFFLEEQIKQYKIIIGDLK